MDLLTIEETAELLHIPVASLRHWIAVGTDVPPNAKIGRRRMFRRSEVEAWVEAKFAEAGK